MKHDFTDIDAIRVSQLKQSRSYGFALRLSAEEAAAMAAELELLALRKTSLTGTLTPVGEEDWQLDARLGATVVQACVVSLAPVTTRIDEPLSRRFTAHMPQAEPASDDDEIEMREDDDALEPLGSEISLIGVLREALALALPPYPRAEGAELGARSFTAPGATPLSDDDVKPFAGLAALKDKLEKDDD